MTMEVGISR